MRNALRFSAIAFICLSPAGVTAQVSGGKVIRALDGLGMPERCIDPYKDKVWLTLRSLTVSKSKQWFTKDKEVSIVINAKVQTDPATPAPISFPLMTTARFGEGPVGQVAVPIEYSVVSGLLLKQDKIIYSGLGAEITLINVKNRNALGSALQALDAITSASKIPIPASPYTQAATYLVSFANSAIQKDIDSQKDDKAVAGAIQFNFDPNGDCLAGDFERTGTKAFVFAEGNTMSEGYVNLDNLTQYCFRAHLTPSFSLSAARIQAGADCRTVDERLFKTVANNYIGLYLNKQSVSRALGPSSVVERDRSESLARCKVNGIAAKSCPGAGEETAN